LLTVFVLVWLIDQRGQPIWERPVRRPAWQVTYAWIHPSQGKYVLRDQSEGSIGIVRHLRAVESMDWRPLATEVCEFRRLSVKINREWVGESESEAWRSRLAIHSGNPAVMLADIDNTRIIWLGYPLDWLKWLGHLACFGCMAALPLVIIKFLDAVGIGVGAGAHHESPRQRALRRGLCPECGYVIHHLPLPRCPECGETWSANEIDRARSPT